MHRLSALAVLSLLSFSHPPDEKVATSSHLMFAGCARESQRSEPREKMFLSATFLEIKIFVFSVIRCNDFLSIRKIRKEKDR